MSRLYAQTFARLAACAALVCQGCAWENGRDAAQGAQQGADAACAFETETLAGETETRESSDAATRNAVSASPRRAITVLTWNLCWFQDLEEGPSDDAAQYESARRVLTGSGAQLIALQEIASEAAFDRLLRDVSSYAGVLSGYDWKQKTALLWSTHDFELISARPVSGLDDAGRPPLEVSLLRKSDGARWLVLVVHAKAQADTASRARRQRFADGLAAHLEDEHANDSRIVLGDFNDKLQGSITDGMATPYAVFMNDPAYSTPTSALNASDTDELSYAWGATVDHILLSADLGERVQEGSVDVLRDELEARDPGFITRVSDHFPVVLTLSP